MGFLQEFKTFALRGNVLDLAVGVIIGGAFGGIVNSLVEDVITPLILKPALKAANVEDMAKLIIPGTAIKYGSFLSTCISFIVIAFCLFLIIKGINSLGKKEEKTAPAPAPSKEEELLTEIRDLLRDKK